MAQSATITDEPERWLPVVGFEGLYEISDLGRVRTRRRQGTRGGLRKLVPTPLGYLSVQLYRDGTGSGHLVHRLVLRAFVGPCPEGMETLHGPGGPSDNRLVNLRWGTPLENAQDRERDGTVIRGELSWNAKFTETEIVEIRRRYAAGDAQWAISRQFGIDPRIISKIVRGDRWAHLEERTYEIRPQTRPAGEAHGQAKLTQDAVEDCKRRYWAGSATQTALAREYGVSQSAIYLIVHGKNWKHVS